MKREQEYTKSVAFSFSDYDIFDRVLPSSFLQVFQDVAADHANVLGCGYEAFKAKNLMWIIVRTRLDIYGTPQVNEPLLLTTKVKKPSGIVFTREGIIKSKDGEKTYATCQSEWCIANITTRKLARPTSVVYPGEFTGPYIYEDNLATLPDFNSGDLNPYEYKVGFTNLDHNGHMNNCRYADALLDAFPPTKEQHFAYLEIGFEKEVAQGDILTIYISDSGVNDTRLAKADSKEGFVAFKARLKLEED